jgi:hypothetical protein
MKLEIELDLNKIDYDAINKQIAEKVSALDIKDMYNVEQRIDNRTNNLIKDEVEYAYNSYLDKRYWGDGTTAHGRELVENLTKEKIENHTKKVMEEIFANEYSEDVMRETMLKVIPSVFASILFSRMESALFSKEYNYYDQIHSMVMGEIDSAIHRMRY